MTLLGLATAFFGYQATKLEVSYDLATIVPDDDEDRQFFNEFMATFGSDADAVVIGLNDSSLYDYENFIRYQYLSQALADLKGVKEVVSLGRLVYLKKNQAERKFEVERLLETTPDDQEELDSILRFIANQGFYRGQLYNPSTGATVMVVTLEKGYVNTERRITLTNDIKFLGEAFEKETGLDLHFAGLPFIRSETLQKVRQEMNLFLLLSVGITALILLAFFRSWQAMVFPMVVIGVMIVWVMGIMGLSGYKMNILTGLLPPIIVVIVIPNCIYLLNKYHHEVELHGNKMRALSLMIRKVGLVTLITNATTGVGFMVLAFTDIIILKEFGLVAGVSIMCTFIVSTILIPGVFTYMPTPNTKQLRHLQLPALQWVLAGLDNLVHDRRILTFVTTVVLVAVSVFGIYKLESVAYMVDDVPEGSQVKRDLAFFEANFGGVMPLEIVVDTGRPRGVNSLSNLRRIERLEEYLDSQSYFAPSLSMVDVVKATTQAYFNQSPTFYQLPNPQQRNFIAPYLQNSSDSSGLSRNFVDSTGQKMRVSLKVADLGSVRLNRILEDSVKPRMEQIFAGDSLMSARVTGTMPLFIKGNQFLIENLRNSMLLAFGIIAVIMGLLFMNLRIIIISILPNLIPIMLTAAFMGFAGIPLKPSTALIFSIAFGISVDDSIHFLAKYRQELIHFRGNVSLAVSKSIRETGSSMIYTSIVLFFGFVIFTFSGFGGTVWLGLLTSITLLLAMLTNLTVLPSLLLTFDTGKRHGHPIIEDYDTDSTDENDGAGKSGAEPTKKEE